MKKPRLGVHVKVKIMRSQFKKNLNWTCITVGIVNGKYLFKIIIIISTMFKKNKSTQVFKPIIFYQKNREQEI